LPVDCDEDKNRILRAELILVEGYAITEFKEKYPKTENLIYQGELEKCFKVEGKYIKMHKIKS
jgi:hypothetical protein